MLLSGLELQLEIMSTIIAFVGCLIAAVTDYKESIVPDKLNYTLIVVGAVLVFFRFSLMDALIIYSLAIGVFLLGLLAYIFGQVGGGDVKLFTALVLLLPWYPSFLLEINPFNPLEAPYPFIVSVFFLSAVIAVFFISIKYLLNLFKDRNEIEGFEQVVVKGLLVCMMFSPLFVIWLYLKPIMITIIIPMILGVFLIPFKEIILERYVVIEKEVEKLTDDDVIAVELLDDKLKKKLGLSSRKTFFNRELKKIKEVAKKHNIKKILVSEHLPKFVPYVFTSLLINLLLGDAFLWMLSL